MYFVLTVAGQHLIMAWIGGDAVATALGTGWSAEPLHRAGVGKLTREQTFHGEVSGSKSVVVFAEK